LSSVPAKRKEVVDLGVEALVRENLQLVGQRTCRKLQANGAISRLGSGSKTEGTDHVKK
jgi:hypothetical protein